MTKPPKPPDRQAFPRPAALHRIVQMETVLSMLDEATPNGVWARVNKTPPNPPADKTQAMTEILP